MSKQPFRIGIVGYGHLGKYLCEEILKRDDLELVFVWNRTRRDVETKMSDKTVVLQDLEEFKKHKADLIVEVAHPSVVTQHGPAILAHTDLLVGSPTAFADEATSAAMYQTATRHSCYVPSGAFWGAEDIQKMANRGTLQALKVTMTKHPSCFKLNGQLQEKNANVSEKTTLFSGAVRELCPLAPNNVNTMATAAIAGHNLGFDKVEGAIVADPGMPDYHLVEVDAWGPGDMASGHAFHVHTVRKNPANLNRVTGSATYASFLSSMLAARNKGPGVHLC